MAQTAKSNGKAPKGDPKAAQPADPATTLPKDFDPKIATDSRSADTRRADKPAPAPNDKNAKNAKASNDAMEIGRTQLGAGNVKDALEYLDKAVKLQPTNAEAVLLRGQARFKRKMYPEAMADLNKAVKLLPQNADAYYWRGVVKQEQDKDKDAILDFTKCIELNPEYADAYWGRAHSMSEMDEPNWRDKACPDFVKAAELGSEKGKKDQKKYCEKK